MKKIEINLTQFLSLAVQSIYFLINERTPSNNFRFCSTKFSRKHGHDICVIQVKGKSIYPEFTAAEIINNPELLLEFSREDVVTITKIHMHIEYLKKNKMYSICEMPLRQKDNIFIIQKVGDKNYNSINSSMFSRNIDFLENFSSIDAYNFGYVNGVKEMRDFPQQMKEAKEKEKNKKDIWYKIRKLFVINAIDEQR